MTVENRKVITVGRKMLPIGVCLFVHQSWFFFPGVKILESLKRDTDLKQTKTQENEETALSPNLA